MAINKKIEEGFLHLSESAINDEVRARMKGGASAEEIIKELQDGITAVGDAFGDGRMFVSDLMVSAAIFERAIAVVMPDRNGDCTNRGRGEVVIGTVKDDVHNIGKDLTSKLLKFAGFKVTDVGVDVEPGDFVNAIKASGAKVLAISCLLTSSYPNIIRTIDALKEAGIRSKVKIIVGGATTDENVAKYCGADAYGANARSAVVFAEKVYAGE